MHIRVKWENMGKMTTVVLEVDKAETFSSIKSRLLSIFSDKKIDFSHVRLKTTDGEECTDESSVGIKMLKHFAQIKMSVKKPPKKDAK